MSITRAIVLGTSAMLIAGSALAGKVNMPKEGSFDFDFCMVGETQTLVGGDKVYVSNYRNVANLRTEPSGKPFDRSSALCYGTFASLNGKPQDFGVCELTDMDGDKWWMEYHGSADGAGGAYTAGTYTAAHGTGKYEGMAVKGHYVIDHWPGALKDGFMGCNHNKGTYKLK